MASQEWSLRPWVNVVVADLLGELDEVAASGGRVTDPVLGASDFSVADTSSVGGSSQFSLGRTLSVKSSNVAWLSGAHIR